MFGWADLWKWKMEKGKLEGFWVRENCGVQVFFFWVFHFFVSLNWGEDEGGEGLRGNFVIHLSSSSSSLFFFFFFLIYIFLCNKDMRVNLYKIYFLSSHFSSYPNKRVFHLSTFLLLTKHKWGKIKYFLSSTFPPSINQSLLYGNILSSFC